MDGDSLGNLAPAFLTEADEVITGPWAMSAMTDFVYPETTGERPPDFEDRLNFQQALSQLAVREGEIYKLLMEVRHVRKPLSALDDPSVVRRVKEEMANVSPA